MADSSPLLAPTPALPRGKVQGYATTLPIVAIFLAAMLVPFIGNDYWVLIASRAAIYWILVSGLNLVVGFAGQLAIGYVALLTLGAYTASVLVAGNAAPPAHTRDRSRFGRDHIACTPASDDGSEHTDRTCKSRRQRSAKNMPDLGATSPSMSWPLRISAVRGCPIPAAF